MRPGKFQKITVLLLICTLSFSSPCHAGILSLIQKLQYKEVYIMDPNGREIAALVNRFTDKVEYSWFVDKWIKAPQYVQRCYENQRNIRAWFMKGKRHKR